MHDPVELRSIRAIVRDLAQPLPEACVATKKVQGATLHYLHWWTVAAVLDEYAPGWHGAVVRVDQVGSACAITYRLTIPSAEGLISREATGQEEEATKAYGDSTSNAEAMAFKRAASKFGLGAYLYDKDRTTQGMLDQLRQKPEPEPEPESQTAAWAREKLMEELHATWDARDVPPAMRTAFLQKLAEKHGSPIPLEHLRATAVEIQRRIKAEHGALDGAHPKAGKAPRRDSVAWDTIRAHQDNADLPEPLLDQIHLALDNPETTDLGAHALAQLIGTALNQQQRPTGVK